MDAFQQGAVPGSPATLGEAVRTSNRLAFTQAVAEDRAMPFVLPYSVIGPLIVPTLWLCIPHTGRPWLYQTRWLVMAFVIVFDMDMIRRTSSTNVACSYAAGLLASWGIVSTMNLLIWKRPQFEAARVMRRAKKQDDHLSINGSASQGHQNPKENGIRLRKTVTGRSEVHKHQDDQEFEYYWQPFPEHGSFLQRFGWVVDLTISFRFSGMRNLLLRKFNTI